MSEYVQEIIDCINEYLIVAHETGMISVSNSKCTTLYPQNEEKGAKKSVQTLFKNLTPEIGIITREVRQTGDKQTFLYHHENGETVNWTATWINKNDTLVLTGTKCTPESEARSENEKKERYLKALVKNADDIVCLLDKSGTIQYISPSIETITGYSPDELVGTPLFDLLAEQARIPSEKAFGEMAKKPGARVERTNIMIHKDGREIWIEGVTTNLLDDPEVAAIVANYKDISERHHAQQKLDNAFRLYAFLSQVNQCIVRSKDEESLLQEACDIAIRFGRFTTAWIGMYNESNNTLSLAYQSGMDTQDLPKFKNLNSEGEGAQVRVIKTAVPYVCNDIRKDPTHKNWHKLSAQRNWNSGIVLPIRKNGVVVATFNILAAETGIFNEDEIALLEEVTGDISYALAIFEQEKTKTRIEKELAHAAYRLSQAQEIAHIGSWELDFNTGISRWSDESCRIYGLDENDHIQNYDTWLSFIHPDDLDTVRALDFAVQNNKTIGINHRIVRRDGTVRHIYSRFSFDFDANGKPSGIHGIAHDVTETKIAETALIQSEENLRRIIDLMPQSIFIRDLDGNFHFINESFAKLYDLDKANISGHNFAEISFGKETLEQFKKTDTEMYESAAHQSELDVAYTDKKGYKHLLNVLKVPFKPADKPVKAVLGVVTDVTEQRKAEEEKNKMIADILRRNKNLEQFSYIISHNLRGPVANIIGLASALKNNGLDEQEETAMKDYLVDAANKMDGVIRDLNFILEIRENLSEQKTTVMFEDILKDVKTSLRQTYRNEQVVIHSDFHAAEKTHTIRSFMYSIFYNLITNSIKYRKPGLPPEIWISTTRRNDKIHLIFKDNGLGIDLKKAGNNLFGLYKRFHNHADGTGVGLYMVRTQVETLGGTIDVVSEPDGGTEFIIALESQE